MVFLLINLLDFYVDNRENVILHVFQYIEMLKQIGVQEWSFREVNYIYFDFI